MSTCAWEPKVGPLNQQSEKNKYKKHRKYDKSFNSTKVYYATICKSDLKFQTVLHSGLF